MYTFTYRRSWVPFSRSISSVVAHSYNKEVDKMWVMTSTGAFEILGWSKCSLILGADWKAHIDQLETEHITRNAKAE